MKIMILRIVRLGGFALVAVALLSGCSTLRGIFVGSHGAVCPTAGILVDTASLTAFRPELPNDPAGVLYAVDLNSVTTDCSFARRDGQTDSGLHFSFRATRSPNGESATYSVPYYVVVAQGARVLSKRNFTVQFSFAPGAATATFKEDVDSTVINLENGKQPYDYQLLVGLQLTPAQQDYNKKMGRFAQ
ncbi:MAG TPA: hypothetical protein VIJ72_07610 [Rhizomicrobium sp.]